MDHALPPALIDAVILLGAAVATAALCHRIRISPVLGYLLVGAAIGPHGFRAIAALEDIEALAQLAIVFLLFSVGLDLPLRRLWVMRRLVLGLGLGQVALTSLVFGLAVYALGFSPAASVAVGGALALSSTAVGLQLLIDHGELPTRLGRAAIAVLLVQDIAVVPLLIILPGLASGGPILETLGWAAVQAAIAFVAILALGRLVLRPLVRAAAATRASEIFAASVLLVVLGTAALTAGAGLSMALGALLAGMLLAESEYRHQVEADIKPARGILLALFFLTVGMDVDAAAMADDAAVVGVLATAIILANFAVLLILGRLARLTWGESVHLSLVMAHAGEFAFVILAAAVGVGLLDAAAVRPLILAIALTLALCPLLDALGRRLARRLGRPGHADVRALAENAHEFSGHVIIAGFGRVGQLVARMLDEQGVKWIALELDGHVVTLARRRGEPVHYADGTRVDVLEAAGLARARALAVTIDKPEDAERAVAAAREAHAEVPVLTRARDVEHAGRLSGAGATHAVPETLEASLVLAGRLLKTLGAPEDATAAAIERIRRQGTIEPPVAAGGAARG